MIGHYSIMSKRNLSPNAAAKLTGISRSAIMRALASKALFAQRDNKNRWLISPDDLAKWADGRPDTLAQVRPETEPVPDLSRELASSKTEVRLLREQLDDTKADRDAWRSQAEALSRTIGEGRTGFWSRIFRA
jgi:hypothetical protein